jgi:phage I-like protein
MSEEKELFELEAEDISFSAVPEQSGLKIKKFIQILPLGTPKVVDGRKLKVDDEDLEAVLADLNSRTNPIPVIYSHGKGPTGEEAAGWIDTFQKRATGLFGLVDWLPETVEKIRAGKWKFISPSFIPKKDKENFLRPRTLYEVTLTNMPAIDGMMPVEADIKPEQENSRMALSNDAYTLLGLSIEATDAEVEAKIMELFATKVNETVESPTEPVKESLTIEPVEIKEEKESPETDKAEKTEALSVDPEPTKEVVPDFVVSPEAAATVELSTEAKEEEVIPAVAEVPAPMESMTIEKLTETVEFKVSERLHEIKVNNLLEQLELEGKIIPATRKSFSTLAHADFEAFSVVSNCLRQVAPVKSVVSGKKLNVPLEALSTGDFYTKAAQFSAKHGISVPEAVEYLTKS